MKLRSLAAAAAFSVLAAPALAHSGGAATSGLAAGLAHPMAGLDHVLAMLAVGMLGAVLGGRAVVAIPASFLAAMMAGGALGLVGIALPFVEAGILLSVVALGAAVALARPGAASLACVLTAGFALFHGHAHGTEAPVVASGVSYVLGFAAATALMHAAGILAAIGARRVLGTPSGHLAVRAAGGLTALAGVVLFVG
jgi:urease accessory protein